MSIVARAIFSNTGNFGLTATRSKLTSRTQQTDASIRRTDAHTHTRFPHKNPLDRPAGYPYTLIQHNRQLNMCCRPTPTTPSTLRGVCRSVITFWRRRRRRRRQRRRRRTMQTTPSRSTTIHERILHTRTHTRAHNYNAPGKYI